MRISDWSSDVCSSDLYFLQLRGVGVEAARDDPDQQVPLREDALQAIALADEDGTDVALGHVLRGVADRGAGSQQLDLLLVDNAGHNIPVHAFLRPDSVSRGTARRIRGSVKQSLTAACRNQFTN